jgi:hypothetical protein
VEDLPCNPRTDPSSGRRRNEGRHEITRKRAGTYLAMSLGGHQGQILNRGLGDQSAVEGILVNAFEVADFGDVVGPQGKGRSREFVEGLRPPAARVAHVEFPFMLLSSTSQ